MSTSDVAARWDGGSTSSGATLRVRPSEPNEVVDRLVRQLSFAEKLSLVTSNFPTLAPKFPELSTQEMRSAMVPSSGYNPGIPRLGIPPLRETDAGLGVANPMNFRAGDTATAFPGALAVAATFCTELAFSSGAGAGSDARTKGFNVLLGGGANLTRDPWGGRNFEYFGEDPLLCGVMAGSAIAGVQSNRIACTVKHYVLNPQETGRMVMNAMIAEPALRESDLLAFQIAIESGQPASVMSAYNRINGVHASEHQRLNVDILKGEWGFDGWVMSDWGGVHSCESAVLGGLDQESGIELDLALNGDVFFTDLLATAIGEGRVSEARLDDMVRRILTGLANAGVIGGSGADISKFDRRALSAVAEEIATAGIVLLKNEGGLLPLQQRAGRVLIVGGHADVGVLSGGGSSQVLSNRGNPVELPVEASAAAWFARTTYHGSSPLNAMRELRKDTVFDYCDGKDAVEAARLAAMAQAVVVFATQWMTEGVDASTLSLPDDQDALIDAIARANPQTIVVLETGGPVLMPWLNRVSAVVAAWYPGERGGEAIAKVLCGEVSPSGRLPMTFPAHQGHAPRPIPPGINLVKEQAKGDFVIGANRLPSFDVVYHEGANVGYRYYEIQRNEPLFPFGFGLSYSNFRYDQLELTNADRPLVSLMVTNTGSREAHDVPQVYVRAFGSDGIETWRLAGFTRVLLNSGEKRRISIELEPRCYAYWCVEHEDWRTRPGQLPLAVSRSATDHVLFGTLTTATPPIEPTQGT